MDQFKRILGFLVAGTIPVLVSVLAILVLLSPVFINIEYRRPTFPVDSYGFTTEERLEFGNQTRRYLITSMSLDDLQELTFDDGSPIFEKRELSHLQDVKLVLKGLLNVFYGALFIFSLGGYIASSGEWWDGFVNGISLGGKIITGLVVIILVLTLISFQALFTNFHLIFFEGDSWLFSYSDSLIRLFPIRFWQDIFLVFGMMTLLGGIFLGWVFPVLFRCYTANRSLD
jgi:integral membrane protein (TIGR01906 family)